MSTNTNSKVIHTKVRGISQYQNLMLRIMNGEVDVEHIYLTKGLKVIVKTMSGEEFLVGNIPEEYQALIGSRKGMIKSWKLTGGDPTDVIGKYGRLMKTIGMNVEVHLVEKPMTSSTPIASHVDRENASTFG